jgi:hypothetical protein
MAKRRTPKAFNPRTRARLERRPSADFRPATKAELKRMGFSIGSQRLVERSAKRISKNTPSLSRRKHLEKRAFETAGVRLSLEKLAERRRTGEIAYRTAAAAEQAGKQRETRRRASLIEAALRAPPPFTPAARRPVNLRRGRALAYSIPEAPQQVKAALRDKIIHQRFVENGTWQHVQDWLRAHGQDELADLFRHSGPSTPGAGVIL